MLHLQSLPVKKTLFTTFLYLFGISARPLTQIEHGKFHPQYHLSCLHSSPELAIESELNTTGLLKVPHLSSRRCTSIIGNIETINYGVSIFRYVPIEMCQPKKKHIITNRIKHQSFCWCLWGSAQQEFTNPNAHEIQPCS